MLGELHAECLDRDSNPELQILSLTNQCIIEVHNLVNDLFNIIIRIHCTHLMVPFTQQMEEDPEERLLAEMSNIAAEKWTKQDNGVPKVPKSVVVSVRRIVQNLRSNPISGKR